MVKNAVSYDTCSPVLIPYIENAEPDWGSRALESSAGCAERQKSIYRWVDSMERITSNGNRVAMSMYVSSLLGLSFNACEFVLFWVPPNGVKLLILLDFIFSGTIIKTDLLRSQSDGR